MTTGVTLAEISAAAASAWLATLLSVIADSVVDRLSASSRTCTWLAAIASRNFTCSGRAVLLEDRVELIERLVAQLAQA